MGQGPGDPNPQNGMGAAGLFSSLSVGVPMGPLSPERTPRARGGEDLGLLGALL